MAGVLLLPRRVPVGRWLIVVAAAGFYLEAALGLAGLERTLLAAAIFAVCVPAEAWVLWFLCHPCVRVYLATWRTTSAAPCRFDHGPREPGPREPGRR